MVPSTAMFGLWSYLFGVSNVAMERTASHAPRALRLDADGHCPLFEGLQKCAKSGEQQKETWALISDIRSNVLSDDLTDDMRLAYVHERLHGFFVRHPDWLEGCSSQIVRNGMTLQKFIQAGKTCKQLRNLKKVLGGNPALLVELLSVLQEEESLDATMREQIRMMTDNLVEHFEEESDPLKRLVYVAKQTQELLNPQENGVYVDIDLGSWGSFDDLLRCYAYYKRHGFHWIEQAEQSAHCLAASAFIRPRADNSSVLVDAVEAEWKKWTVLSHRADFKGFLKRIKKIVAGQEEGMTRAQKLVEIAMILVHFATGEREESILNIEIGQWGTVRQFATCQHEEVIV
ncbi:hypothetical protein M3Y99_01202100 [Aphelenchoides fujianensis]|nr:hypothetical protein M3Y99_01202100 [Aphelenchoides fujianensis]